MSDQCPSRQAAFARLTDLCHHVEKLIRLVPHVLPIIGEPSSSPMMSDHDRRPIVDELIAKIAPWEEWEKLCQALPEHVHELELLARVLSELKQRFEGEDVQWEEENEALAQDYADQVARKVKKPRYRRIWEPEREIYPQESDCIRSYLSLVTEALGLEASKQGQVDEKETTAATPPKGDRPAAEPTLPPRGQKKAAAPSASGMAPPRRKRRRQPAGPLVILGKPGDEPTVNGRRKPKLTKAQFDVTKALLAAGDDGLSKDSLATEGKHSDAHRILKRLADSDPDWGSVIQMAGKPGGRYRIRTASLPTSPDISRKAPT
jgi:hypothetical protein